MYRTFPSYFVNPGTPVYFIFVYSYDNIAITFCIYVFYESEICDTRIIDYNDKLSICKLCNALV